MKNTILVLCFFINIALQAATLSVNIGYENDQIFPYQMENEKGLNFELLKAVDSKINEVSFKFISLPWSRCLTELTKNDGIVVGCFPASYNSDRAKYAQFPMDKDFHVDTRAALHWENYATYSLKDNISDLSNTTSKKHLKACAIRGHSVISELISRGYKVHEQIKIETCIGMLLSKRVNFAVLLAESTDHALSLSNNEKLVKHQNLFSSKPNYLIFSKSYYTKNQKIIEMIWSQIRYRNARTKNDLESLPLFAAF